MKLLAIHASPRAESSLSRRGADLYLREFQSRHSGVEIHSRLLTGKDAPPHWEGEIVTASFTPAENRTDHQRALLQLSDVLCKEVLEADRILISTPMWNFGLPSALKAWVDHVVRPGVTFRYGSNGPEGLLRRDQTLIIVQASGGFYTEGPASERDHVGNALTHIFEFMGVGKVERLRIEGTAVDAASAWQRAQSEITRLASV